MSIATQTVPQWTFKDNRLYLRWYTARWRYWRLAWQDCFTKRADGRNRFLWLCLGPVDVRWHP